MPLLQNKIQRHLFPRELGGERSEILGSGRTPEPPGGDSSASERRQDQALRQSYRHGVDQFQLCVIVTVFLWQAVKHHSDNFTFFGR